MQKQFESNQAITAYLLCVELMTLSVVQQEDSLVEDTLHLLVGNPGEDNHHLLVDNPGEDNLHQQVGIPGEDNLRPMVGIALEDNDHLQQDRQQYWKTTPYLDHCVHCHLPFFFTGEANLKCFVPV